MVLGSCNPRPDFLKRAVDSLLGQTFPHWELVLWDDGSLPPGREVLRREEPQIL